MTRSAIAAIACSLAGCIAYPKPIEYYDYDCNIQSRKLVLSAADFGRVNCHGGAACLALLGVGPVSAVVSGSVVVVGNTVYWMEKHGKCTPKGPPSLVE